MVALLPILPSDITIWISIMDHSYHSHVGLVDDIVLADPQIKNENRRVPSAMAFNDVVSPRSGLGGTHGKNRICGI